MTSTLRSLVPLAHVASVERAMAYYAHFGFEVVDTHVPDGESAPVWSMLARGEARIMLALASEPVVPQAQAVLFYLYFDDIQAEHARLAVAGLAPGPMTYPFYCPQGEFRLTDPYGYCLLLTHT